MAAVPVAPPLQACKVRLFFSASDFSDGKRNPYWVLYEMRGTSSVAVKRSETLRGAGRNPKWQQSAEVDFRFESRQDFEVFFYEDEGGSPQRDDLIGRVPFQLAHVVSARGSALTRELLNSVGGAVTIASQPVADVGQDSIVLQFAGSHLKKMDLFGNPDPYFKLFRLQPNGSKVLLHQSRACDGTLDPVWPPCPKFKVADLCGGSVDAPVLLFECWDEGAFSDDKMGQFVTSVNGLLRAVGQPDPFKLKHETKEKWYGTITVGQAVLSHSPTFTEFLTGGLQVNVALAIDFTGSNGDPRNPASLHYMNPAAPNQYVQALTSVCDVVLEYDNDKLVPAFGFGAMLPSGQVSHCFHLNAQPDPNVHGLQGILDSYTATLSAVRFAGPTNFAPSIRQAEIAARNTPDTYTILLIITDGAITDTDATVDAIVACGDAPLSIIIVGVGNADFSTMNMLDGDDERLRNSLGQPAARDLVQFVPFRDFASAPRATLAAQVLEEVPRQVEEWAQIRGYFPPLHRAQQAAAAAVARERAYL